MDSMLWSDMYPCVVGLVTLTLLCSCVKMRSSMFPSLFVGLCMCCSNLRAAIVSFTFVDSLVLMLKSPSIILLLRLVILSVRRLVISLMSVEVVILLSVLGGG